MVRRILCLSAVVISTTLAACRPEPTAPAAGTLLLRDDEAPECVDTVYEDSTANNRAAAGLAPRSSSNACGIVVIYY